MIEVHGDAAFIDFFRDGIGLPVAILSADDEGIRVDLQLRWMRTMLRSGYFGFGRIKGAHRHRGSSGVVSPVGASPGTDIYAQQVLTDALPVKPDVLQSTDLQLAKH